MVSRAEILYHLFELVHSNTNVKRETLTGEHGELYNRIMDKYETLYASKACAQYSMQCAIIGVLAEYMGEEVKSIEYPTCVQCGGCKRFLRR